MRKRSFISIMVLSLVGVGSIAVFAQDLRPTASTLAAKIAAANRKKVAVTDFTDLQGNATQLGRFIAEELSIALSEDAKQFEVIDRTSIRVILQENKLASEGLIDPASARKLGQIAGVDTIVSGTITPLGDSVHVGLKALDTESAKVIAGLTIEIPRTSAINELLGLSPNSSSVDPQDPRGGQGTNIRVGDFVVLFQGCKKGVGEGLADQIVCWGNVTNTGSQREDLAIGNQTYLVDNTGHQAAINWEGVGGEGGHGCCATHTFEPGLPLQFWFDSRGYSDEVELVNVIFVVNGHKTVLRNIRLQGR